MIKKNYRFIRNCSSLIRICIGFRTTNYIWRLLWWIDCCCCNSSRNWWASFTQGRPIANICEITSLKVRRKGRERETNQIQSNASKINIHFYLIHHITSNASFKIKTIQILWTMQNLNIKLLCHPSHGSMVVSRNSSIELIISCKHHENHVFASDTAVERLGNVNPHN